MAAMTKPISITTATFQIRKGHHDTTFMLNRAGGIAITLPALTAGMRFKTIIGTAPTSDCTISSSGGADVIVVSVNELETDTTEDGPSDDNADVVTFKANVALKGDSLTWECDGSFWYAIGQVVADGAITSGTT